MTQTREQRLLKDRIRNHKPSLIMTLLAIITLIATSIYAFNDGETLAGWEIAIFDWINAWPNWLSPLFVLVTNVATIGAVLIAGITALIGNKRRIGLAILLAGGVGWAVSHFLKDFIGRERPIAFINDAVVRYSDLAGGNGFPSGHSTVAAAVAMSLALILPRRWAPVLILMALLVGVSRVYLGVHLPLDVVAGWAIGIIIGYGADFALRVERIRSKS